MFRAPNVVRYSAGSPSVRWLSGRDSPGRNAAGEPTKFLYGAVFSPSALKAVRKTSVFVSPDTWVPFGVVVK